MGCANNNIPGVFARVSEVKNWILTNVPDAQESDCKNIYSVYYRGSKLVVN